MTKLYDNILEQCNMRDERKILVGKAEISELKDLRARAIKQGKETFTFQGQEMLCDYAKYLIMFLENDPEINPKH